MTRSDNSSRTSCTTSSDRICSLCAQMQRSWRRPSAISPLLARPRARSRLRSASCKARTGGSWPISGPAALEELGLVEALEALVAHWRRADPKMAVTLKVDPRVEALGERASLMAYRFVQEAMTNAFRHAGATRIEASLKFETRDRDAQPARSGACRARHARGGRWPWVCTGRPRQGWASPACATGSGSWADRSKLNRHKAAELWSKRVLRTPDPIRMREKIPVSSGIKPEKISNH